MFALNITTTTQTEGSRKEIDWNAMNLDVVAAAGTAEESRSIPGVISGIIDLGEQELPDAEKAFTGTAEDEAAELAKGGNTYFKDGIDKETGKMARLRCWPQKPVQQIAITVDFPQVMVDKGKFFGNSNPAPLRMLLNGEFTLPSGDTKTKIVGRPYNIRETKHDIGGNKTRWAFAKNNGIHKLAAAAKLLDKDGLFTKERIGELLGKILQFEFRVYMKPSKNDSTKTFFTEDIKLVGKVPEGIPLPEVPEGLLYGVNLYGENDPTAVKQLRVCIKNTIKRANNYKGSSLEAAFEAEAGQQQAAPTPQASAPKTEVTPVAPADNFDEDTPF